MFQAQLGRGFCKISAAAAIFSDALAAAAPAPQSRLIAWIKECGGARDLERGRRIHQEVIRSGHGSDRVVLNSLVSMYGKCGSLDDAIQVFNAMGKKNRDVVSWNCLMLGYAEIGDGEACLGLLGGMREDGIRPNGRSFVAGIKACSAKGGYCRDKGQMVSLRSLEIGMALHSQARESGFESDIFVAATLVDMYVKCGSLVDARGVFERAPFHNTVLWNALVMGYVENGESELALELLPYMKREGCDPDARTFVAALKACGSFATTEEDDDLGGNRIRYLERGMALHSQALGLDSSDIFVASALIDMYGKYGSLLDARRVFDRIEISRHDVVSWTALIMACVENREGGLALELFEHMKASSCAPNSRSFVAALKACTSLAAIEEPRQGLEGKFVKIKTLQRGASLHAEAAGRGCEVDIFVANTLLEMYTVCGSMLEARRVFDRTNDRDVTSWNSMILGYVENGQDELALELIDLMEKKRECLPNDLTFVAALKACSSLAIKETGQKICGKIVKLNSLVKGFDIHSKIISKSSCCDSLSYTTNALIDMYTKCGSLVDARRVFDRVVSQDVVSWNVLLLGYCENGEESLTLQLFQAMLGAGWCCKPDFRTFCAAFKACSCLAAKETGQELAGKVVKVESLRKARMLHSQARSFGIGLKAYVASSLVDMLAKCGSMDDSRGVFDRVPVHDTFSWTALMLGYAESGDGDRAMELYSQSRPPEQDAQTFIALLKCVGVLESGKIIHGDMCRAGLEDGAVLEATLVDVYGKWGSMDDAQRVFDALSAAKDKLVSWNALLGGYARQGDTKNALRLFEEMQEQGLEPDSVTFLSVLTACSHAGLAETGKRYFETMQLKHGIEPGMSHYHCMVDVLGRANRVEEAVQLVKSMPFKANAVTWRTVLSACRKWRHEVTGKLAFQSVLETDCGDSSAYVLMANIYNESGS
ncbi:pentatricopeptide repeat-containing protein At4g39530-like isoform X1 [Selaginella moellendorffii]|uniref:pentatricopeptide repeat-containing protein At4g39530-like isoform X1 n=1 Tax=Selaginella moellendorffii TaxID=88036 RepID=UPI000D1CDAC7|nr:pentatricopeptide repeat-containing protein At4g39530-like isoform X1 [Selaginella moellendorffii]|eukprot:XP_024540298.1 pentatricopeptide repeat-containing protein At4g39530-like isoform X1 [Selaginella moellendorffii]